MENNYLLFAGGLFALVGGFFGMSTSAAIALAAVLGLITVSGIGLLSAVLVFMLSFLGAAMAYLWFVAGIK
jgi:hypothetical protein